VKYEENEEGGKERDACRETDRLTNTQRQTQTVRQRYDDIRAVCIVQ